MSKDLKGLEMFELILDKYSKANKKDFVDLDYKYFYTIEHELKAFNIIIKKKVNMSELYPAIKCEIRRIEKYNDDSFLYEGLKIYNECAVEEGLHKLDKDEYYEIKEVLRKWIED